MLKSSNKKRIGSLQTNPVLMGSVIGIGIGALLSLAQVGPAAAGGGPHGRPVTTQPHPAGVAGQQAQSRHDRPVTTQAAPVLLLKDEPEVPVLLLKDEPENDAAAARPVTTRAPSPRGRPVTTRAPSPRGRPVTTQPHPAGVAGQRAPSPHGRPVTTQAAPAGVAAQRAEDQRVRQNLFELDVQDGLAVHWRREGANRVNEEAVEAIKLGKTRVGKQLGDAEDVAAKASERARNAEKGARIEAYKKQSERDRPH